MLRIEIRCSLMLLALFVVSMLGSMSHADIDATFSLFAFYALLTHPQYNSIREVLLVLTILSVLMVFSDFWVLYLLYESQIGVANKFFGYMWTCIEIILKLVLIVFLLMWRNHVAEEDGRRAERLRGGDIVKDRI